MRGKAGKSRSGHPTRLYVVVFTLYGGVFLTRLQIARRFESLIVTATSPRGAKQRATRAIRKSYPDATIDRCVVTHKAGGIVFCDSHSVGFEFTPDES